MSTLIVTLNPPALSSPELDYCLVSNAQTISSHGSAAPALLPKADDTVLLLPVSALSWRQLTLPKLARSTSAQKLRAVIDGMVEEHLLDDTGALHIASYKSPDAADNQVWLAVCDKAWLSAGVHTLQAAGLRLSRIVPQAFPLQGAGQADAWRVHISGTPESALVTVADSAGVLSAPLSHARAVWPALGSQEALDTLTITAEPAVAAMAEATLGSKVTIVQSAQYALQALLDARTYGIDLAQGDMAVAGRGRWLQQAAGVLRDLLSAPAWRAARIGFALFVVANIVGLNAWAWQERSALEAKRKLSTQLLTQTFPQVKVVVDAPVQMQREVSLLRQASGALGSRDLESMYARFAAAAQLNAAPAAIEFAAGEVSIKGSGLGAAQLSALQAQLQGAGLSARSDADRVVLSEAASKRAGATP